MGILWVFPEVFLWAWDGYADLNPVPTAGCWLMTTKSQYRCTVCIVHTTSSSHTHNTKVCQGYTAEHVSGVWAAKSRSALQHRPISITLTPRSAISRSALRSTSADFPTAPLRFPIRSHALLYTDQIVQYCKISCVLLWRNQHLAVDGLPHLLVVVILKHLRWKKSVKKLFVYNAV